MKVASMQLRAMPTRGHPARLNGEQLQALGRALLQRPTEDGFGTELWTLKSLVQRGMSLEPGS